MFTNTVQKFKLNCEIGSIQIDDVSNAKRQIEIFSNDEKILLNIFEDSSEVPVIGT